MKAPLRPLPPLLPLSDPGPRLLPSTLALHRASHLLSARNLESEPLPHPLPPSLHPPAPVDLAEFDIDFILAGSLAQLGRDKKKKKNAPIDTVRGTDLSIPPTPTLKLGPGGEDEDTFAKFVGEFDDEYGDRRGEWTFRACSSTSPNSPIELDPLDKSSKRVPRAEWESPGAGKYELFPTGEVRSAKTGRVWQVRKVNNREYELEEKDWQADKVVGNSNSAECYCLTGKDVHSDHGGVKISSKHDSLSRVSSHRCPPVNGFLHPRGSAGDVIIRKARLGSEDSGATAVPPFATSLPTSSHFARKGRQHSHSNVVEDDGRTSVSFAEKDRPDYRKSEKTDKSKSKAARSASKERSFSGFKKGLIHSLKNSLEERKEKKEEKERDKAQSQSWSGASTTSSVGGWSWSTKSVDSSAYKTSPGPERTSTSDPAGRPGFNGSDEKLGWNLPPSATMVSPLVGDEDHNGTPQLRGGKGWHGVPEDAVAMVIPIEMDDPKGPISTPVHESGSVNSSFDCRRQALLVWYVPFNSEQEDRSTPTSHANSNADSHSASGTHHSILPKILRRRTSKDKELLKKEKENRAVNGDFDYTSRSATPAGHLHPLPFRSFRVVARMVELDDLRSETHVSSISANGIGFEQWQQNHTNKPTKTASTSSSKSSTKNDPNHLSLPHDSEDAISSSTAPTSTIMSGRTFPTVIAVCHSRSQGVEFVLEGLDRLGLCIGESAWGPTGYEEWRGTGLSEKGRELLDLLWAGCTGVMGLCGA